jgi:hypothetical protein
MTLTPWFEDDSALGMGGIEADASYTVRRGWKSLLIQDADLQFSIERDLAFLCRHATSVGVHAHKDHAAHTTHLPLSGIHFLHLASVSPS